MTESIGETLKRLASDTGKENSQTSGTPETDESTRVGRSRRPRSSGESASAEGSRPPAADWLGDPDCPHCHGSGYLRRELPLGHPDFGRLQICSCRSPQIQARVQQQLYSLSQLDALKGLTFDSFKPDGRIGIGEAEQKSIQGAFQRARHFANAPEGWLLLQGGFGVGKTHLAAAIANQAVQDGRPTLFLTVPDLLDNLRATFSADDVKFEERFEQVRRAALLVLDDLGTQSATEWAREKLYQLLNFRYINRLPTVLTTNQALEELEARLRSRISDPELVDRVYIQAPDYRRPLVDSAQSELSSLDQHREQTFGTFSLRKNEKLPPDQLRSLEEAFKATQRFAEEPQGWLLLGGGYGVGKTHLAAAIASYRALQGFPAMFVVVPDLLDHLRSTFSPKSTISYDRRFEEIRNAPLLVLDDLGTQATTPWVREKLYQLFNHRYVAELPTVITSAELPEKMDPRLRSRMDDRRLCIRLLISAPSFRGGKSGSA